MATGLSKKAWDTLIRKVETQADKGELEALQAAINTRSQLLWGGHRDGYEVGDVIEFVRGISPRYMEGKRAVVNKVNAKSVVCAIADDPAYGRFAGKKAVRCAKSVIKHVRLEVPS